MGSKSRDINLLRQQRLRQEFFGLSKEEILNRHLHASSFTRCQ